MNTASFKIGTRLGLGFGAITIVMLGLIALGVTGISDITHRMDDVVQRSNRKIWLANVVRDSVQTIDNGMLTLALIRNEEIASFEYVRILTARATYRNALEELETLTGPSGDAMDLLLRLKAAMPTIVDHYQGIGQTKPGFPTILYYMEKVRPTMMNLHQICTELVGCHERHNAALYEAALGTYRSTVYGFIVAGLTLLAAVILASWRLTKSITAPLRKGVEIANSLAGGNLSPVIQIRGNDETGQLLAALKNMAHKLRETKDLEHQLFESQKLETLGRLSGGIAHDFNNMLNVILGNAQLIKMRSSEDKKVHDRCSSIEEAVSKAAGFVRQLLAFSRRQVMEMKTIDLNTAALDFEKMVGRVVGEHIDMEFLAAEGALTIKADPAQIQQILLNLIVNAKEAMPNGGKLIVETYQRLIDERATCLHVDAKPGRFAVLSVTDTGVGMNSETVSKVFEPFFTTKEHGNGLGLSVVYGIVKQHGGFVEVLSEKGKGTMFNVYFPLLEEKPDRQEHRLTEGPMPTGRETILLVEDENDLRSSTALILRSLGYVVHEARDGLEGLAVFKERCQEIDLLLLDMVMPKLGGREACEEMKKLKPSVKYLFVSGYSAPPDTSTLEICSTLMIQKPYSGQMLARKIREVLVAGRNEEAA
jgi:signal transduction histidine kinase